MACFWLAGCIDTRIHFRHLPPSEQFVSIQPGVTTRAEVLRRLGPPDEVRQPAPGEAARRLDSRERRIIEAGEIFDNTVWTWATEERSERIVGLLPVLVVLFRVRNSQSLEERWRIEFDESGVVRTIAHVDEIGNE